MQAEERKGDLLSPISGSVLEKNIKTKNGKSAETRQTCTATEAVNASCIEVNNIGIMDTTISDDLFFYSALICSIYMFFLIQLYINTKYGGECINRVFLLHTVKIYNFIKAFLHGVKRSK